MEENVYYSTFLMLLSVYVRYCDIYSEGRFEGFKIPVEDIFIAQNYTKLWKVKFFVSFLLLNH